MNRNMMPGMMNFGGNNYMNRGMGGQPQPQRQGGNRRNNNRGNNRFSRFDQGNQGHQGMQNRNPNYNSQNNFNRQNKEIKQEPATPQKPPVQAEVKPQQTPAPVAVAATPAPTPAPAQKPAAPVTTPVKPVIQPNQNVNKPQQQQQNVIKNVNTPLNKTPQHAANQQNKPPPQQQNNLNNQNRPQQQQQQQTNQANQQNKPPQQNNQNRPLQQNNQARPQLQNNQNRLPQQNNQSNPNNLNKFQGNLNTANKPQHQSTGNLAKPQGNLVNSQPQHQSTGNLNKPQGNQGMRPPQRRNMNNDKIGGGNIGGRDEHFMMTKLKELSGSMVDLPPLEQVEQKFSGRNRLYIGNLTNDITEQELLDIFNAYGETAELFVNKDKNFAFIRIDYKANAEKAKREVDGRIRRGRPLRVRFAPHNAAIKVKNLTSFVSNELLYKAFEIFGKIERAIVKVDERGKSLGEGLVEFHRKAGAMAAIRHCSDRCFFLTASLRPVVVESLDDVDEADGYTEKSMPRKNQDFIRSREIGPRFAEADSFEHEYGTRWKQLHELYKQKEEALHREMHMEEDKLEAQMEYAKYEHETELLREQLRQREQDRERQKRSWEMAETRVDEMREQDRVVILRQQEEMTERIRHQEDELRRRQQENTLFMQAQQLNRILDEQEQGMGGYDSPMAPMQDSKRGFDGPMSGMGGSMDAPYMEHFEPMGGRMGFDDGLGRWDSRQDDFPNKRRRY